MPLKETIEQLLDTIEARCGANMFDHESVRLITGAIQKVIEEEREACAKELESYGELGGVTGSELAQTIRARK